MKLTEQKARFELVKDMVGKPYTRKELIDFLVQGGWMVPGGYIRKQKTYYIDTETNKHIGAVSVMCFPEKEGQGALCLIWEKPDIRVFHVSSEEFTQYGFKVQTIFTDQLPEDYPNYDSDEFIQGEEDLEDDEVTMGQVLPFPQINRR